MGQAIPIYVINLDRRADRRDRIGKRMDQLGLSWTRLRAIDADDPGDCPLGRAVAHRATKHADQRVDLARAASHVLLWQRFLEDGGGFALVLEDDLTLSDQLPAYLHSADWIPGDADLVKIEKYQPATSRVLIGPPDGQGPDGRRLHRLYSRLAGAGGYLIRREAAQACSGDTAGLGLGIDRYLFDYGASAHARHLTPYFLQPALVTQFATAGQDARHAAERSWRPRLSNAIAGLAAAPRVLRHALLDGARMRDVRWQNHASTDR